MDSTTVATAAMNDGATPAGFENGGHVRVEIHALDHGGSAQFRAALEQYMGSGGAGGAGAQAKAGDNKSLGNIIAERATNLAGNVKEDQQYVSKMLEQATRTGDSLHLMRAMMALNDFQLRVQTISKTVAKSATAIDSLTKLQ